ncbi:CLC_0170 family protein [Paenibacillus sp. M1]|uniref:CLC_0170 family protein n=1 Tax=Paenibacillus haidiansis TaxID=1574488 RepID=A0ABU7VT85_9BACL
MTRVIFFVMLMCFCSSFILLAIDGKIYSVERKNREKAYSRVFGWIHLSAALLLLAAFIWLY